MDRREKQGGVVKWALVCKNVLDDKWELYYKTYQSITNTKEL